VSVQTQVYFFNQRQEVVLLESVTSVATRRYEQVYAKELTVVKGVDNIVEFSFINQFQKPVNLTDKIITARIISADGRTVLLQKTLTSIYPITGLMKLEISGNDIDPIEIQKAFYTLSVTSGSFEYPAFTDALGASRGTMNIVNGVMPDFMPSLIVSIPTHPPVVSGIPQTYSSSVIPTLNTGMFTLQAIFESFTGSFQIIGSVTSDFSISYDITTPESLTDYTGSIGSTVEGYHPYVKLVFINTSDVGDVTEIFYR
jgi:hypothetical protein